MQGVLTRLEELGLVERKQDVHHGRRQLARLTSKGHAKAKAANVEVMRVEKQLETAVLPNELQAALELMDRLHLAMIR